MSMTAPSTTPPAQVGFSTETRYLAACLVLGCKVGLKHETLPIATALVPRLGDVRKVQVLMAIGTLFNGDASVAQAALAQERVSGEADAATLVFALGDRLAGNSDAWRPMVERVLATSSDPTWRAVAYAIAALG